MRCKHMRSSRTPHGVFAACVECGAVQLDDDRSMLDVRWTLLRDPDAAPLRHDRAVTAADARWQFARVTAYGTTYECVDCGERVDDERGLSRQYAQADGDWPCACTRIGRAADGHGTACQGAESNGAVRCG